MTGPQLPDVDHGLHDALEKLTRQHGAMDLDWLAVRARKELRDARINPDTVAAVVDLSTMLVWRPDDTVDHLLNVLDGVVLTQRVRAPLAGREDLWCTVAMQPLLNITAFTSLPLADGTGHVRQAASGQDVLVGPAGWLPDVPRYGLVGLRLEGGRLSAAPVDEDDLPDLTEQEQVRQLLAHHYRLERWYGGDDDLQTRPAEMVRALQYARLEDPKLLSVPHPPLDELLYLSLDQDSGKHYWRDWAAFAEGTVSLAITGLPEALYVELDRRAKRYGMSLDQFVIAVLGHLAWRTPFAEDMGPWDDWNPDRTSATVRKLSIAE
ncbi:MAG TPA: hypothetical protein VFY11_13150 [Nocardioidaceae bacterium]|nr:hypothetical protein [Nocardioidaceae bacterium]